jgi:hypothetical protein
MSTTAALRSLNINNINPRVREAKYAVRGELAVRSEEYRAKLAKGATGLPFDKIISANIGNPQQLDQKPITFFRQVLSLVEYPPLLEHEDVLLKQLGYKSDIIERARWLLKSVGSVGAYSASAGAPAIKESIAKFLESSFLPLRGVNFTADILQDETDFPPKPKTSIYPLVLLQVSIPSYTLSAPHPVLASWYPSLNTHSIPPPYQSSTQNAFPTILTSRRTGAPISTP